MIESPIQPQMRRTASISCESACPSAKTIYVKILRSRSFVGLSSAAKLLESTWSSPWSSRSLSPLVVILSQRSGRLLAKRHQVVDLIGAALLPLRAHHGGGEVRERVRALAVSDGEITVDLDSDVSRRVLRRFARVPLRWSVGSGLRGPIGREYEALNPTVGAARREREVAAVRPRKRLARRGDERA